MPTPQENRAKFQAMLGKMSLPVIGSPLFIISNPKLVIEQCKAGVIGSFPALNARPQSRLDEWIVDIKAALAEHAAANPDAPIAPYAVNQIVHRTNNRLMEDMETCVKHEVPIVITSLGAREEINEAVHSYGGMVFHDVINNRFAKKAIEKGADGLVLVAAGAGGHAGSLSPFALIQEVREWFDGPIWLSGCIATGSSVLAAKAMGADAAYMGSAFIATEEANATDGYKDAIVECGMEDIVYSNLFTGVHGNYLKPSIEAAGMDPDNLPEGNVKDMSFKSGGESDAKAWKDIWGCGQGIGAVTKRQTAADYIAELQQEYQTAREMLLKA